MKKLFTNDKFFGAVVIISLIGATLHAIIQLLIYPDISSYCIPVFLCALCELFLYTSYCKHSKNTMKGMMGALLMGLLLDAIFSLSEMEIAADKICAPIYAALVTLMFINHFIINSNHHSSPAKIKLNQILVMLLVLVVIVWNAAWSVYTIGDLGMVSQIAGLISFPCMMATIVCVESRLDAYRLDREAAGWTEEAGYPEGYVHEYEKK